MFDLELSVDCDWVMDSGQHRQKLVQAEQAPPQRLVVVDEVEVGVAVFEVVPRSPRKGHGFGKVSQVERRVLEPIPAIFELEHARLAHWKVIVEGLEARQFRERNPLIELWIWWAAEYLDGVPKVDERLGQVPGIDALAANMWFAPIREVGNPKRFGLLLKR